MRYGPDRETRAHAALRYVAPRVLGGPRHMEREIAGPADDHTRRPGAPAALMRLGTPGRRDRRAWSALWWEARAVPPTCTTSLICRNLRRRRRSGHSAV